MKIIEWDIPLNTATTLARYSKPDRASLMKIADKLTPGINRLKEIMLLSEEIALMQKSSIADVTKKCFSNISEDSKINTKELTEKIRKNLKELRYPQLTTMEKKWNEYVKELHLPPDIKKIQYPEGASSRAINLAFP